MCNIKQYAITVCLSGLLVGGCSEDRGNGLSSMRGISGQNESLASASTSNSGVLIGYVRPTESRYDITLSEIRGYVRDNTAVFIDARGPVDFAFGHVRGALNMPAGLKEAYKSRILESVSPDQFIVIYCNGPYCDSGNTVYEYLASQGFSNMRIFKPGWRTLSSEMDLR